MTAFWWGFLGFFAGWGALILVLIILGSISRFAATADTDRCNWNDDADDEL